MKIVERCNSMIDYRAINRLNENSNLIRFFHNDTIGINSRSKQNRTISPVKLILFFNTVRARGRCAQLRNAEKETRDFRVRSCVVVMRAQARMHTHTRER